MTTQQLNTSLIYVSYIILEILTGSGMFCTGKTYKSYMDRWHLIGKIKETKLLSR